MTTQLDSLFREAKARYRAGNLLGALELYDRYLATDIGADHSQLGTAWAISGDVLYGLRRFDEAVARYDRAIALNPNNAAAYANKAAAQFFLHRLDDALTSANAALERAPVLAEAHNTRGNALRELRRFPEAIAAYERAIALMPTFVEAHVNLGNTFKKTNQHSRAIHAFTLACRIDPHFPFVKGFLLHAKMLGCDWTGLGDLMQQISDDLKSNSLVAEPFGFQATSTSEAELRCCAEIYAKTLFPRIETRALAKPSVGNGKIRIGYVAGEFRHQATSILLVDVLERHDKDRFEIFAFDNGWDDGSDIRRRLKGAFTEIVNIAGQSDADVAEAIQRRNIDILINLNGYFGEHRPGVFARKPAPIQVNYLGFPGTIGADYIDYIIADETVLPTTSCGHYTEKVVHLPNSYQPNDRQRQIATQCPERAAYGLPKDAFVFCCFNNNYKITPQTFESWMRILLAVEGSVLWLLEDNAMAAENLRAAAAKHSVAAPRLIFAQRLPLPDHLARHQLADLFLDTQPYNAHTTASDALWAGLPILTQLGETFPGRVTASLLRALDLPELIVSTPEAYVETAIRFARAPTELRKIREKLWRNRETHPLFDSALYARHLEAAYSMMVERSAQGLPPDHIVVPR